MHAIRPTILALAASLAMAAPAPACNAMATTVPSGMEATPHDTTAAAYEAFLETATRVLMACQALPAGILPCGLPAGAMAGAAMATEPFPTGTR